MGVFERGLEGVTSHLHGAEAKLAPGKISRMPTSQTLFSADGRILAAVNNAGVSFYDTAANPVVREIPAPGTIAIHFSPGESTSCTRRRTLRGLEKARRT